MEIRRHPITGDPVIYAPERALRPNAYASRQESPAPSYEPACPFCPGNEHWTPPEVARVGEPWQVRVFPNKYPFAAGHEVIVESPAHDADFATLPHAAAIVAMQFERQHALAALPGIRHVAIFKNRGLLAGASLDHPHSQVAAITFVPPRVEREAAAFRQAPACPLCRLLALATPVGETERFVMIAPAATFSGELWIVPREHQSTPYPPDPQGLEELATLLQSATRRVTTLAAAYNWMVLQFPDEPHAHGYVEIVPRNFSVAGFELATGTFIDSGSGTR